MIGAYAMESKCKKKMLYIMGIDWMWIYQRPHILAEKLSQEYELTVIFPRSILRAYLKNKYENDNRFHKRILWTIPYQEKNKVIEMLIHGIQQKIFNDYQLFDYIYIGYPLYARYIKEDYQGKLIYDCMDNHEALYSDKQRVHRIIEQEKQLLNNCDIVIVTSQVLFEKVNKIAEKQKAILIRNGAKFNSICDIKIQQIKKQYKVGYIGTIAQWFDYNVLECSLRKSIPVTYHIIGPVKTTDRKKTEGIVYEGSIEHKCLAVYISEYDCLIMPFKINEIVLSVDPVKLYEYIAFGKCIISVFYPEIERFRDFVYFYNNMEDYCQLLTRLCNEGFPTKYNEIQQRQFLHENSWDERYEKLIQVIKTDKAK